MERLRCHHHRDHPHWSGHQNIFDPASMVTGGVSGIAIIGKELWNLPLWVTNTVLNIPLFLAGFKIMGWKFIKRTLYATVLLSVAFYILPEGMYIEDDLLLSALLAVSSQALVQVLYWPEAALQGEQICWPL